MGCHPLKHTINFYQLSFPGFQSFFQWDTGCDLTNNWRIVPSSHTTTVCQYCTENRLWHCILYSCVINFPVPWFSSRARKGSKGVPSSTPLHMQVSQPCYTRAHEGGSECRVSRSNFWQCRVSAWKWECRVSILHSVALWLIEGRVSSVGLIFECRMSSNFQPQCRIEKLDNVRCRKNPLHGYLY